MKNGCEALKTHTSINMLSRKGPQGSIRFTVGLNKDNIPNFDDIRKICIHAAGSIAVSNSVVMDFLRRATFGQKKE